MHTLHICGSELKSVCCNRPAVVHYQEHCPLYHLFTATKFINLHRFYIIQGAHISSGIPSFSTAQDTMQQFACSDLTEDQVAFGNKMEVKGGKKEKKNSREQSQMFSMI